MLRRTFKALVAPKLQTCYIETEDGALRLSRPIPTPTADTKSKFENYDESWPPSWAKEYMAKDWRIAKAERFFDMNVRGAYPHEFSCMIFSDFDIRPIEEETELKCVDRPFEDEAVGKEEHFGHSLEKFCVDDPYFIGQRREFFKKVCEENRKGKVLQEFAFSWFYKGMRLTPIREKACNAKLNDETEIRNLIACNLLGMKVTPVRVLKKFAGGKPGNS